MSEPTAAPRFTLRDLPLPAKLVVTVFLLAVGVGYTSAMVQLHMQHGDRDGTPLPTADNVVAVFAGVKKAPAGGPPEKTVSRLEAIVSGSPKGNLTSKNMTPAFFAEDGADYEKRAAEKPGEVAQLDAERDGDRQAMIAWINAAPEARKQAYQGDTFTLPPARVGKPMSAGYRANGSGVHIRSLIRDRCTRCHGPGGDKSDTPLKTYEQIAKYLPTAAPVAVGGYVDSGKQISLEKLTQSTHAHLLSFAMLFALTGLTFAFSGFPGWLRCILGPGVLVAQVADVSCWWLARLPVEHGGPGFARCIIFTGAAVGLGLMLQILLSLFSMYGRGGRVVLVLLFAVALGGGAAVYQLKIARFLDDERKAKEARVNGGPKPEKPAGSDTPNGTATGPSRLEKVLNAKFVKGGSWNGGQDGKPDGGMVRAFFDKDQTIKDALAEKSPELDRLLEEREGERLAVLAWVKAAEDVRQKAYEDDAFVFADPAAKTLAAEFKANDTTVKVKTLLGARCVVCHKPDGEKDDAPLLKYDDFTHYLKPGPAAGAKADTGGIPPAKE